MKRCIPFFLAVVSSLALTGALDAQGTAFSYQGRLLDGGSPANGTNYSLAFYLYDAPTGGSPLANLAIASVTASNGLFTVPLDFGNVFDGQPRWLEVSVEKTGPGGDSGFTTLAPREEILSTPYAIQALNASNLVGTLPAAQLTGQILTTQLPAEAVTNGAADVILSGTLSGNGAGLTNLSAAALPANAALLNASQTFTGSNQFSQPVTISGAEPALKLLGPGGGGSHATLDLSTYDPGTNAPSARLQTADANWGSDWDFYGKQPGANTNALVSLLHISANGYIGIGTTNPQQALHVVSLHAPAALFDSSSGGGASINLRSTANLGTNWQIVSFPNGQLGFATGPIPGTVGPPVLTLSPDGRVQFQNGNSPILSDGPERIVHGIVNAAGGIVQGFGFTVTHPGLGSYNITFNPPFSTIPTVTATAVDLLARSGASITTNSVRIGTVSFSGAAQDDAFHFIAIGTP